MTKVLDLEALRSADMRTEPWPWGYYENALRECDALAAAFPVEGLAHEPQRGVLEEYGRRYDTDWATSDQKRDLVRLGEREPHQPSDLDELWIEVAYDLLSDEYQDALSELTKVDLRPLKLRASFHSFNEDYSCKPHLDEPQEVVSHLIYLDDNARKDATGHYKIYRSGDSSDIHTLLPPKPNQAVIQVRTEEAWHDAGRGQRKMIHITFESEE